MKRILTLSLVTVATVMSTANAVMAQTTTPARECRTMGGTANLAYLDAKSGAGAMTGDFEGGVYFRMIGEPRQLPNGRVEMDFEHLFVTKDGSTLRTRDKSWGIRVPGSDAVLGGAAYTVVEATGDFKGKQGTFNSWGAFDSTKGQAVLRYEGQICR